MDIEIVVRNITVGAFNSLANISDNRAKKMADIKATVNSE
jgi:hypothetical protein